MSENNHWPRARVSPAPAGIAGSDHDAPLAEETPSGDARAASHAPSASRLNFFGRLALFEGLPRAILAEVALASKPRAWAANTLIFQRGEQSTSLFALEKGRVRISLRTAAGRELVLQQLHGAATIGEIGLLDGSPHAADALTMSAASGHVIDGQRFAALLARHPELARSALRHVCALVRDRTDHLETIALYDLHARLSRFLLSALRRTEAGSQQSTDRFMLDLSQSEIADLLASSRPKVNQAMMFLTRTGAIARSGRFITCDRSKLVRLAAAHDWQQAGTE